jgi:methyltransferase (TIGR00027 family)
VREGEPSRTAFGAAVHRAAHADLDRPVIFQDPLAWRLLGVDREAVLADVPPLSRLRVFIAARHRFAEDVVAAAVTRGVRQVVVLGAGLDTFAYRQPQDPAYDGLRVFEVDFPATGAWKRERLAEAGIHVPHSVTYVGVDFERDDLMGRLLEHGFDSGSPAEFMWLGVVPYLTRDAVTATLRAIATVPGAEVVLDYPAADGQTETPGSRELAERVAAVGEPFSERWEPADLVALLADAGFDEVEDLGRPEIRSRYLGLEPGPPGGGAHVVRARRSA